MSDGGGVRVFWEGKRGEEARLMEGLFLEMRLKRD